MRDRRAGSVRSSRGAFFREPERRSSEKQRSQRVKLRRRYASSVVKRLVLGVFKIVATVAIVAGLIYGGVFTRHFWRDSSAFRVASLQFQGDIPPSLRASFPIKPGDHLFGEELERLEASLRGKYPELDGILVSRRLDRSLRITGHYKVPEALTSIDGKTWGVYRDGTLFPITEHNPPAEKLPLMQGKMILASRQSLLTALKTWKKGEPTFCALVKRLETDNIGDVRVILEDGVVVQWGEMSESELLVHAANILNVLDRFTPTRTPALLRVVSKNRIVMDSNWKPKKI